MFASGDNVALERYDSSTIDSYSHEESSMVSWLRLRIVCSSCVFQFKMVFLMGNSSIQAPNKAGKFLKACSEQRI